MDTLYNRQNPRNDLTAEYVRSILHYAPETGQFTWLPRRDIPRLCNDYRKNKPAGSPSVEGYVRICINRRSYFAHRLAWLYMTGEWPALPPDHINRARTDNRWSNLRLATSSQSQMNRETKVAPKSGARGVCKSHKRWLARISANCQMTYLGTFDTMEDASAAYKRAAALYHGEFSPITNRLRT